MNTVTEKLPNGNEITYQVLENGHCYHVSTDSKIIGVLERAWYANTKLKIYFGDVLTGKDWNEENDTIGTIGFSTGRIKIPLLITSSRSHGGGALLDDCIVKIKDFQSKCVMYQNHLYVAPQVEIIESDGQARIIDYTHFTVVNGKNYGYHKSLKSAQICASKIK